MTADSEPNFIDKPKEEDGPEIPEKTEEEIAEIEDIIDDGEACTDIGKAM